MRRFAFLGGLAAALSCSFAIAWGAPGGDVPHREMAKVTRAGAVRTLDTRADALERNVVRMETSARRFRTWIRCISLVRVGQYGDKDHAFGFEYDERDGSGLDHRPALALLRGPYRSTDYAFLDFAKRPACRTAATVPGGTAEDAEFTPTVGAAMETARRTSVRRPHQRTSLKDEVRRLRARTRNLQRRAERLEAMSERFDEWESCLSWVPVTEYGDPDGRFGYLLNRPDGSQAGYRTGIAVDESEWDDPDYEVLAFVGRDRPFTDRECGNEPGESVD